MSNLHALTGRVLFRIMYPVIRLFPNARTRVLITDGRGNVLLMRGWFGRQRWDLPGGGIKQGEKPDTAAIREVLEETGVRLAPEAMTFMGEFSKGTSNLSHAVLLYYAKAPKGAVQPASGFSAEVLEVQWWPVNRLPPRMNMFVLKALRKLEEIEG